MALSLDTAPKDGREITLWANLAPLDCRPFFARGHYDKKWGWVVKRDLIGCEGFELLNVNAMAWLPF
jgi:hypothetical protein